MSVRAALASAAYGLSIGAVHSVRFALRNLIKFPLLILVTASVCSICYYILARWFTRALDAPAVARATLSIYHDTAVLLASLSPVTLFLALTIERPDRDGLHEYPMFLSVNVVLVALSGSLALVRQCRQLQREYGLAIARGSCLIGAWLAASLFVGAQASWYMRPFCGVVDAPFMLGTQPDFRGATSFYEAVYHVFQPPPNTTH
ncbi:MAG TPA: hypothetical protein VFN67_31270 [Polyangiales bacterium]|nr:hypothetical protein [Polyangiales bacterium]